jgi:hypothetical protein
VVRGAYFLELKEGRSLPGIKPPLDWVDLHLVFDKSPPRKFAYEAMVDELERVAKRGVEAHAYIYVGNKQEKPGWKQARDPQGGYMVAHYSPKEKIIYRIPKLYETDVLKRLQ